MGFSCFICRKPFQEQETFSDKGGGDGQMDWTPTATATKCGHLFHSNCIAKNFSLQSPNNAWAPKTCPVCSTTLSLQDVIRVRACPYDDNGFQRPAIDDLNKQLKQIQAEKAEIFQRYENACRCNNELRTEIEMKKQEFDELSLRAEQLMRHSKVQASDLENSKIEIEKLKNMVIKLTERMTGDPFQDNSDSIGHNGMPNALGRIIYANDLPFSATNGGYDLYGPSSNGNGVNNFNGGSQMKNSNHSHPPGFALPFSMSLTESVLPDRSNNGVGLQNSSNQQSNMISGLNHEIHKLAIGPKGPLGNAPPGMQVRSSAPLFARANQEPAKVNNTNHACISDTLENTRKTSSRASMSNENNNNFHHTHDQPASMMSKDSPLPPSGVIPFKVSGSNNSAIVKPENLSFSSSSVKEMSTERAFTDPDFDDNEGDGKWLEKTSRSRRGNSKTRGGRSATSLRSRSDDKRYGYFKCETCKAEWGSSKSILNQPQTCRYCKTEVHPYKQDFILSRKQLEINKKAESQATTAAPKK